MDINKFLKNKKQSDRIQTTITLDKDQVDFLKKHELNLSALVRDVLNKLIDEQNKKEGAK